MNDSGALATTFAGTGFFWSVALNFVIILVVRATTLTDSPPMPTIIKHRKVRIVVLASDELLAACCIAGDIAIEGGENAWWTRFVGPAGQVDSYDEPYASYNEALWAAKAAAEFGLD